jgi:hypothetical protein
MNGLTVGGSNERGNNSSSNNMMNSHNNNFNHTNGMNADPSQGTRETGIIEKLLHSYGNYH